MKRVISAAAAATLMIAGSTAFADATDTDTIVVGSNVSEECNVNAVSTGINITVALDQVVADLTIECNLDALLDLDFDFDGELENAATNEVIFYSLDVDSTDGFIFEPTFFDNEFFPFTMLLDNTGGDYLSPKQFEVRVNVDEEDAGEMFAGEYQDEIVVTIGAS